MDPTKTLLTLLVCLLPLSVSAGELDGKSLICEKVWGGFTYTLQQGYRFNLGKVIEDSASRDGTNAVVVTTKRGNYKTTSNLVMWEPATVLDRKTLKVKVIKSDAIDDIQYQCEVVASRNTYYEKLESSRLKLQEKINEEMKGNKI